jgi:antitoxin ParD1/3/4
LAELKKLAVSLTYSKIHQLYDLFIQFLTFGEKNVANVRKTITLTEQQNAWIAAQIEAGHYTNDSEAIRDLIRREQQRSAEFENIRTALINGENSGEPKSFDAAAFKQRMNAPSHLQDS